MEGSNPLILVQETEENGVRGSRPAEGNNFPTGVINAGGVCEWGVGRPRNPGYDLKDRIPRRTWDRVAGGLPYYDLGEAQTKNEKQSQDCPRGMCVCI